MTKLRYELRSEKQVDNIEKLLKDAGIKYKKDGNNIEFLEKDATKDILKSIQKIKLVKEESGIRKKLLSIFENENI